MSTLLAIDAGQSGSKVRVLVEGEPAWDATLDGVRTNAALLPQLAALVREARRLSGFDARTVALGVSGWTGSGPAARDLLEQLAGDGVRRVLLAHDSVTSFLGALGDRRGAVVAAGTGAVTIAVGAAGMARIDGWGYSMGDAGSAYWIGSEALHAVMRAHDGRGPATALTDLVSRRWPDLEAAYVSLQADPGRVRLVASFAEPTARLAGIDAVAHGICRRAARELAHSAVTGLLRVGEPGTDGSGLAVAGMGGVFRSDLISERFRHHVLEELPGAAVVAPSGAGVDGAALLAGLEAGHPLCRLVDEAEEVPSWAR
ncbi:N-acetylglucosamine kinase [Tessaracoccus sp. G1721]